MKPLASKPSQALNGPTEFVSEEMLRLIETFPTSACIPTQGAPGIPGASGTTESAQARGLEMCIRCITAHGITFEALIYNSSTLQALHRRFGQAKVIVRFDAEDMSRVFVASPDGASVEVECLQTEYAAGLTLRMHRSNRRRGLGATQHLSAPTTNDCALKEVK